MRILGNSTNKNPMYPQQLHKCAHVTYAHIYTLIKLLESNNIISTRKNGRIRSISLTSKGKEILNHIDNIYDIFSKLDRVITIS